MIGIFDSGLGGLIVYKSLSKYLSEYNFIYLGDTARLPYGNRSQETVYKFTQEGVDFLFQKGCVLIIIACNTATALALRKIQTDYLPNKYPAKKVLGVIRPLAEAAIQSTKNNRVGVIGTRSTILSGAYEREMKSLDSKISVFQNQSPLLVPFIEEGWIKRPEIRKIIKYYLRPLKRQKIDTLILGCTHYPVILKLIQVLIGKRCTVLDPGEVIAKSLLDYLKRHPEINTQLDKKAIHDFYVTDINENFERMANYLLGKKINLKKVNRA